MSSAIIGRAAYPGAALGPARRSFSITSARLARVAAWAPERAPAASPDQVDEERRDDHRKQNAAAISIARDGPPDEAGDERARDADCGRLEDAHRIRARQGQASERA